jgi:hypothetical protein
MGPSAIEKIACTCTKRLSKGLLAVAQCRLHGAVRELRDGLDLCDHDKESNKGRKGKGCKRWEVVMRPGGASADDQPHEVCTRCSHYQLQLPGVHVRMLCIAPHDWSHRIVGRQIETEKSLRNHV